MPLNCEWQLEFMSSLSPAARSQPSVLHTPAATRWLRRKRVEKRAEQQAARENSRRLVLEERRARRMRDLLCVEDKPFRFSEHTAYQF